MSNKKLKDPIYGYIEISDDIVRNIIDTSEFQRLRDIIQTSYSPLYASSLHNRFVHSIGVYHLGGFVVRAIERDVTDILGDSTKEYLNVFRLACLLHDVGHAPFSHTGEDFYLKNGKRDELHKKISELTNDENILDEIKDRGYKAAPHELMSVIVSLEVYSEYIPKAMRSFFARCIMGYFYTDTTNAVNSILNCLIEMLNSKVIDVDKMDYLIRDAYTAGFETVAIDYERFLSSVCVYTDDISKENAICYSKASLSIVENIVYARDMEKKWIQNHPSVLYECNLVKNVFECIIGEYFKNEYIEEKYLTSSGDKIANGEVIRLLSDADIRYLMKQLKNNIFVDEYLNRGLRKHPLWKTEAEYRAIFDGAEEELKELIKEIDMLMDAFRTLNMPFVINNESMQIFCDELKIYEDEMARKSEEEQKYISMSVELFKNHISFMGIFERHAKDAGVPFDFTILKMDQFTSGFGNTELTELQLLLPEMKKLCRFGDVSGALSATNDKKSYFYLYYNRAKAFNNTINLKSLAEDFVCYGADRCKSNKASEISGRIR